MKQVTLEDLKKWVIDQYSEAIEVHQERASTGGVLYMKAEGGKEVLEKLCRDFNLGVTLANWKVLPHQKQETPPLKTLFLTKIGISGPFGYTEILTSVCDNRKLGGQNSGKNLMRRYYCTHIPQDSNRFKERFDQFTKDFKLIASVITDKRTSLHRVPVEELRDYDAQSLLYAIIPTSTEKS